MWLEKEIFRYLEPNQIQNKNVSPSICFIQCWLELKKIEKRSFQSFAENTQGSFEY